MNRPFPGLARLFSLAVVLGLFVMVSTASAQTIQTAILNWGQPSVEPEFYLETGGTYKLQFILIQEDTGFEFLVEFINTDNEQIVASRQFYQTSPACEGAETVTLAGGAKYRMKIEYSIGPGNPEEGTLCKAKIFYTCSGS